MLPQIANATPNSKCYVAGEAVLRAEHLLLYGIPNLETYQISGQ
jgi:hypothetical protein